MGLILDTSVLIDAERRLLDIDQMLEGFARYNADEFALSSLSLMELSHGVVRAKTGALRKFDKTFSMTFELQYRRFRSLMRLQSELAGWTDRCAKLE